MQSTTENLKCVVVTPERAVLDQVVDFVALPMYDGELGVLPGHTPMIGRLGYGELRLRTGTKTQRYFIDGGFVQVRDNVVTVLTARAVRAEDIDTSAAAQALQTPPADTSSPESMTANAKLKERARAQLRVAHHAGAGSSSQPH